jgi:hypothetical protein
LPDSDEPLIANEAGTILQGNTRAYILMERGIDLDSLPRETYSSVPVDELAVPGEAAAGTAAEGADASEGFAGEAENVIEDLLGDAGELGL